MKKLIGVIVSLSFAITLISGVKRSQHNVQINGYAQGTTYHIIYVAGDSLVTKAQIDGVFNQLDSSLSIYKPYSLINQFNNSASGVRPDMHLYNVVKRALEIFNDTDGRFDITVYPLVTAWGFGNRQVNSLPDSTTITSILPYVGSQKLKLSKQKLTKTDPRVKIDVNGIAQGYSADVVAGYLEKHHIKNYLVEIGGEIRVRGRKADGSPMKIGVESPARNSFDDPVLTKIITMNQGAVTTSGNYRKYVESNGHRISHLINPKTGFSIISPMVSVTVVAADGITADGYDNPLMSMRLNQAFKFMARHKGMEAYFIYHQADGRLADTATAGFYKLLTR